MLAVVESDESNTSSDEEASFDSRSKQASPLIVQQRVEMPKSDNPMDQGPRKASGSGNRSPSQEVLSSPIMTPDETSNKETKSTASKEVKSSNPKSLESLPYLEESKKGSDQDFKSITYPHTASDQQSDDEQQEPPQQTANFGFLHTGEQTDHYGTYSD